MRIATRQYATARDLVGPAAGTARPRALASGAASSRTLLAGSLALLAAALHGSAPAAAADDNPSATDLTSTTRG